MQALFLYLRNAAWMAGERLFRIFVALFLFAYIARYLGPQQFGLLNYAIALVSLTIPIIALGLNRLLVRELVKEENQQELLGTVFVLKLLVSIASVMALILVCTATGIVAEDTRPLVIVAALGNLFMAFDVIDFYFQSRVEAKYTAIYKALAFFLVSALKLIMVFLEAPLIWFAIAHSLEWAVISALAMFAFLKLNKQGGRWRFSLPRGRKLIGESWPEIVAGVGTVVCMRLDRIMLEALVNIEAVGIYTAATRLSDLWYFVPTAIVSSTFPAIVRIREQSLNAYHSDMQKLFLVSTSVAYGIAIPTALLAPYIISLLFGEGYQGGAGVLSLHIWSLIAVSLGLCSGSWIFAEGRIILSLYRMVLGAICNALLNWLLIPLLGGIGAAIATVISLFVAFYLFDALVPSMRHLFVMKTRAILLIGLLAYMRELYARSREARR